MQNYPYHYQPPPRKSQPRGFRWRTNCTGCLLGCGIMVATTMLMCLCGLLFYIISPPPPTNILILGNDNRPGDGEEKIARTDSILILGVNPPNHQVSLLSLPRDVFITSPVYGTLRANTVVREAEVAQPGTGVDTMMQAMEFTFTVELDNYIRLDFEGFVDMVNALGGISIDVPDHIVDELYPTHDGGTMRIEFQPGKQHMDGETALIYARTRHSTTDYDRANRQQQVISAVMSKLSNPFNWYRLPDVWRAFDRNTSSSLGIGDMITLFPGILLYGRSGNQIDQLVLSPEYLTNDSGVVEPNMVTIQPWIDEHLK